MKAPKDYASAQRELRDILEKLRGAEVDVDALGATVKRAKELIEWSQTRLRQTQEEIDTLFSEQ